MPDQGQKHEGGQIDLHGAAGKGADGHYRDFHAYEHRLSSQLAVTVVMGEVQVPNPGVEVSLSYAVPQGINPAILLLRIEFYQRPGIWPQVLTWKQVHFARISTGPANYTQADVVSGGLIAVHVPVQHV